MRAAAARRSRQISPYKCNVQKQIYDILRLESFNLCEAQFSIGSAKDNEFESRFGDKAHTRAKARSNFEAQAKVGLAV
eukprot:1194569-Prorocentrum_minimum.AAC.3